MHIDLFRRIKPVFNGSAIDPADNWHSVMEVYVATIRQLTGQQAIVNASEAFRNLQTAGLLSQALWPSPYLSHQGAEALRTFVEESGSLPDEQKQHIAIAMLAALMVEIGAQKQNVSNTNPINHLLFPEIASYAALDAALKLNAGVENEIEDRVGKLLERGMKMLEQLNLSNASLNASLAETHAGLDEMRREAKSTTDRLAVIQAQADESFTTIFDKLDPLLPRIDQLETTVNSTDAGVAAFTTAVRESMGHEESSELWRSQAKSHRIAFWVSGAVVLFLLVGVPLIAFFKLESIFAMRTTLQKVVLGPASGAGEAALTIGAVSNLIFTAVPLILFFWLIRFLIRYNQHNLLLMEDALQRHTMMDVYVKLIADQQASPPEDRRIVLEALFRPTVSQVQDSADMPNVIELIKPR